jgi:RNA polymerase sigma-70 factor (ECF subfamily)
VSHSPDGPAAPEPFELLRERLFGIAYGVTGSVADAEDLCQEAWLRWSAVDPTSIEVPEAYLVRIVTNAALDRLRSAHAHREQYVGPYLPEPLITATEDGPLQSAELADELTFAFLVMLDELNPVERAVILLHDVFGYSFAEVARTVDRTPEACRQLASRSRHRAQARSGDVRRVRSAEERVLIDRLIVGTMSGDVDGLMALLAEDIVQIDDGGARQRAARHPIVGRDRVARFMINLAKRLEPDTGVEHVTVNGCAGLLFRRTGEPWIVFVFEFAPDGLVRRIFAQLNPDKLGHLSRPLPSSLD